LTVEIPDEVYERAERRAAAQGAALAEEIARWLRGYGDAREHAATAGTRTTVDKLFSALDHARNTTPIGPLKRDELHDRDVLR
jgi:hypothetical protein